MDTGICHARGKPQRYMYSAKDGRDMDIMDSPVHVWNPDGSGQQEMTLRQFNAGYIVDRRFDTSRIPEGNVG